MAMSLDDAPTPPTRRGRLSPRAQRALRALMLCMSLAALPARADAQPSSTEEILRTAEDQADAASERAPLRASLVEEVNLKVNWQLWKRVISEGQNGRSEMEALCDELASAGVPNTPALAIAAPHWVRRHHAAGALSTAEALQAWGPMRRLAPDLPHVYMAEARFTLRHAPGQVGQWSNAAVAGITRHVSWPLTGLPLIFNLVVFTLVAATLTAIAFIMSQLVRSFGVLAYDAARLLPRGFSSNQAVVLLLALVLVPGILMQSPLLSGVLLLALLAVVQQWRERAVTLMIFAMIAALPWLEVRLSRALTFPESDSATLLRAATMPCDEGCATRVSDLLEAARASASPDHAARYVELLLRYRRGELEALLKDPLAKPEALMGWPEGLRADIHNLVGAALIAQRQAEAAIPLLERAQALASQSPAAPFNLMRARQELEDSAGAMAALDEANKRSLTRTLDRSRLKRRDVNSALWVEAPDAALLVARHDAATLTPIPFIARAWPHLAGPRVPLSWALGLGLIGLALSALSLPLTLRGKTSTPCPQCGLARDPSDGARTGDHPSCQVCYTTLVTGSTLDYNARIASEDIVRQRNMIQRMMRRGTSLLVPGMGHMVAGRALVGGAITMTLLLGVALILRPHGVWRGPQSLPSTDPGLGQAIGVFLLCVAGLIGLMGAARDIDLAAVRFKRFGRDAKEQRP